MSGARRPGSWSLAARLIVWYACSAFALVLAVTAFLYWGLNREIEAGDNDLLLERIHVLRSLLRYGRQKYAELRWEVESEWEEFEQPQLYLRILDQQGQPFLETPGMARLVPVTAFPPAAHREPKRGTRVTTQTGRSFLLMASEVKHAGADESWVVQVASDVTSEMAMLHRYRYLMVLVLAASALTSLALGYRITRSGLRPLAEIVETTRRIRSSTLGERVRIANLPAELVSLAENFNAMLVRLQESFTRISRFSADIAHELRTPLNILRGEAEVALRKTRTPGEYCEVLSSSLVEYAHLSKIIDCLLFIALAENSQTPIDLEMVDVAQELRSVAEYFEPLAAEQRLDLRVEAERSLHAPLDKALLRRAVANLVSNAIAYTPPGGAISLSGNRHGAGVRVQVSDTGAGIAPEHLAHVFERFYRVGPERSRSSGSAGLGLSIVRTVMDLHGGSAEITSRPGAGTLVTLIFPQIAKS